MSEKYMILTTYREKIAKRKNKRKTRKPLLLMSRNDVHKKIKKRSRGIKVLKVIVMVALLIMVAQYAFMRYQMARYTIDDGYACVHMSYDAEKFFEGLGFNVVQRRVDGVHRWIAIEIWDGVFIDYESTLNIFGLYLINERMTGQYIWQSEGFFKDGKEIINIKSEREMHTKLSDWKIIGEVGYNTNIQYFEMLL